MWILLGMWERRLVQMVQVTWPRCPPCPYMLYTFKNLLLWNRKADDLGMQHGVCEYYQVCSNNFPGLILTYFTARLNLVPYAKKLKQWIFIPRHTTSGGVLYVIPPKILKFWMSVRPPVRPSVRLSVRSHERVFVSWAVSTAITVGKFSLVSCTSQVDIF